MIFVFFRMPLWFLIWCLSWATLREHRSTSHRFSPTVVRYLLMIYTRKICFFVVFPVSYNALFWACQWSLRQSENSNKYIYNKSLIVSRLQNTRRFFSIMVQFRTLLLYSSPPPIRYWTHVSLWISSSGSSLLSFTWVVFSGPDAGVKVLLSPGLWEHSGFHDTDEW